MDLNELLHAHQVAVMRASARGGSDAGEGDDHFAKVAEYAERVRNLREMRMADEARAGEPPQTIIYGTYAGDHAAPDGEALPDATQSDEALPEQTGQPGEGADTPAGEANADGEYTVGGKTYSDLDLAVTEHLRQMSDPGADPAA